MCMCGCMSRFFGDLLADRYELNGGYWGVGVWFGVGWGWEFQTARNDVHDEMLAIMHVLVNILHLYI